MKLASIEQIKEVKEHPNADRLELVTILGYQLVCEKGLHKVDDIVIYIQPDTVLPQEEWAETYRKYSPKRIKCVKLRGEFSEGIAVRQDQINFGFGQMEIGTEVSNLLGVTKYEPPIPQDLSAKRLLPFNIPVTDEERWENLDNKIPYGELCDVTLKVDGQSWSMYYNIEKDEFGILGRRFEFKDDVVNNYTNHLKRYPCMKENFIQFCKDNNASLCLRGESYGPGIQAFNANPHSKNSYGLAIFSVWNMDEKRYMRRHDALYFRNVAESLGLNTVPFLEVGVPITHELIEKYSVGSKRLLNGNMFEGVVINHAQGSFKVINKHYDSGK